MRANAFQARVDVYYYYYYYYYYYLASPSASPAAVIPAVSANATLKITWSAPASM
jgi:hypothetical protein